MLLCWLRKRGFVSHVSHHTRPTCWGASLRGLLGITGGLHVMCWPLSRVLLLVQGEGHVNRAVRQQVQTGSVIMSASQTTLVGGTTISLWFEHIMRLQCNWMCKCNIISALFPLFQNGNKSTRILLKALLRHVSESRAEDFQRNSILILFHPIKSAWIQCPSASRSWLYWLWAPGARPVRGVDVTSPPTVSSCSAASCSWSERICSFSFSPSSGPASPCWERERGHGRGWRRQMYESPTHRRHLEPRPKAVWTSKLTSNGRPGNAKQAFPGKRTSNR